MSNPTSNFGWQMPTSTDLVTDLPADFEVFGQAVDTSLADLKGGTTGQVLAKATGTDMDFTWTTPTAGMTNPMTTTGDTIYSSSGSTPARLGIGSTGQVLTVSGGLPAWGSAPESTYNLINTGGTALTGATSITVSSLSGYSSYYVLIRQASSVNANSAISMTVNGATTGAQSNFTIEAASTYSIGNFTAGSSPTVGTIQFGSIGTPASGILHAACFIFGGASTGQKAYMSIGGNQFDGAVSGPIYRTQFGLINPGAAISSMTLISSTGNFDNGTIYIYGAV